MELEKVVVWYGGKDCGDGSTGLFWFLSSEKAEQFDENGEGSECVGSVETFVGSDIHQEAIENESDEDL